MKASLLCCSLCLAGIFLLASGDTRAHKPIPAPRYQEGVCSIPSGTIVFKKHSAELADSDRELLDRLHGAMNGNACKVVVLGSSGGSKRSVERVDAVIDYLVKKYGTAASRFIARYAEKDLDRTTVKFRAAERDDK